MDIVLEFISGENAGKKLKFSQDAVLVGRSEGCDLCLASDMVSHEHCRFTVKADGVYLADLGSTNGTYINGTLHGKGFIAQGDKVSFGEKGPEARITFSNLEKVESRSPRPAKVQTSQEKLTLSIPGGRSFNLPPGKITIGREDDCDVVLDHALVSRAHAEITYAPPNINIRDLNSTNGIYINGRKVMTSRLNMGDKVVFGEDGPEIVIGIGSRPSKSKRPGFLIAAMAVIVLIAILAAGYFLWPRRGPEIAQVEDISLNEYVSKRLMSLSDSLGDPQQEIPLIFVEGVVKHIRNFTGKQHDWFERSLRRSVLHIGMVKRLLRGAGLPEEFAYLAFIESGYDSTATSPAGAKGLWQFMPRSAPDYGLQVGAGGIDERIDPKKSTEAACKYIKQLYNLYNSYMLAMASYNTGEGRIAGALRRIDVIEKNRFWYLVKNDMLHDETVDYVPKIMAAMILATDPQRFGFADPAGGK